MRSGRSLAFTPASFNAGGSMISSQVLIRKLSGEFPVYREPIMGRGRGYSTLAMTKRGMPVLRIGKCPTQWFPCLAVAARLQKRVREFGLML